MSLALGGDHPRRKAFKWLLSKFIPISILEVGSDQGGSAAIFGEHVRLHDGELYCVDPWEDCDGYRGDGEGRYQTFLNNMWLLGLQERVTPIRKSSFLAAGDFSPSSLDMVYIDGLHDEDSVTTDLQSWASKVRTGGLLTGDDFGMDGVVKAWVKFAGEHNLELHTVDQVVWTVV